MTEVTNDFESKVEEIIVEMQKLRKMLITEQTKKEILEKVIAQAYDDVFKPEPPKIIHEKDY